jgi:hypothetical protein
MQAQAGTVLALLGPNGAGGHVMVFWFTDLGVAISMAFGFPPAWPGSGGYGHVAKFVPQVTKAGIVPVGQLL